MRPRVGGALIVAALLLGRGPAPDGRAAARAQGAAQAKFAVFVATSTSGETQVEPVAFLDGRGAFEEPVSAGAGWRSPSSGRRGHPPQR